MRLTRRAALLTAAAAAATATRAGAQVANPVEAGPPPWSRDDYGLKPFLGDRSGPIEVALRGLGEPALLPPAVSTAAPTFRLLEMHRRPRSARIIFDQIDGGATVVLKRFPGAAARSATVGGKPIPDEILNRLLPGVLGLDPEHGLRLRMLVDDQDRFWNGASDPPKWGQIMADAQNAIYVTADGWSVVLEGHVGPKRHAILRSSPAVDSWLGRISEAVFGSRTSD